MNPYVDSPAFEAALDRTLEWLRGLEVSPRLFGEVYKRALTLPVFRSVSKNWVRVMLSLPRCPAIGDRTGEEGLKEHIVYLLRISERSGEPFPEYAEMRRLARQAGDLNTLKRFDSIKRNKKGHNPVLAAPESIAMLWLPLSLWAMSDKTAVRALASFPISREHQSAGYKITLSAYSKARMRLNLSRWCEVGLRQPPITEFIEEPASFRFTPKSMLEENFLGPAE